MGTLEDIILIQQFVLGRLTLSFNQNLRVESAFDTVQLLTKKGGLLATVKLNSNLKTFLVRQNSNYWELINQILLKNSFKPTRETEHGLMKYEYCQIPPGYEINYSEARLLWKTWRTPAVQKRLNAGEPQNLLIHTADGWEIVKGMAFSREILFIKTYLDEMMVNGGDRLVWLSPLQEEESNLEKPTPERTVTEILAQTVSEPSNTKTVEVANDFLDSHFGNIIPASPQPSFNLTKVNDTEKTEQRNLPSSQKNNQTNKSILSVYQGKLYIQTIEGEVVVEGSHMKFWFSPPEGQETIPEPIEVRSSSTAKARISGW
jgi:hypothetical protein